MLSPPRSLLALCLAAAAAPSFAAVPVGGFKDAGNTLVSAMMMFLGNEDTLYIMDKAEGNRAQIAGHPAWASKWDIHSGQYDVMDVPSNIFCSSGMHLPNGSYATFGGNGAVGRGGNLGSQLNPGGFSAAWDAEYQDFDGSRAIRILDPCKSTDNFSDRKCTWFDDATQLAMKRARWYSTAEPTADGTIVLLGGFSTGGYINRNYPNNEPNGGGSQNTYEFFPARDGDPPLVPFLTKTSGLNAYVHAFLLPSGNMFLQANYSTVIWNYNTNTAVDLPDMPGQVIRVYPASGGVAMLPLTPENDYTPTIIFCGGSDMDDYAWGNFSFPFINTWEYPASKDCQRITPEPTDGSAPAYIKDDDMLEGRSMGQFIILPDGKLLMVNGALNGTAGYAQSTNLVHSYADMPYGESLANGPVLTPALYDPEAPPGQRWSREGFQASKIPRLYHSSAMLLPDGSVFIAGSNPNVDVNLTTIYPTTYDAEIFYPPYFSATHRPQPTGVPSTLSYGGAYFNITIPASSYSGPANEAAEKTFVSVLRGGFTTHAMNMGQRFLKLRNTYTVQSDGSIILHVSQMPPKPEVFQPGPAFIYVVVNGVPSNGTYAIVGSGRIETQPKLPVADLPPSQGLAGAKGTAGGSTSGADDKKDDKGAATSSGGVSAGTIIGAAVGGVAVVAVVGAIIGICLARRRRAAARAATANSSFPMSSTGAAVGAAGGAAAGVYGRDVRGSDTSAFVPLAHGNQSHAWNASTSSFVAPYKDDGASNASRPSYDPYARDQMPPARPY